MPPPPPPPLPAAAATACIMQRQVLPALPPCICSEPPPRPQQPLYGSFVRPVVDLERTSVCRRCSGSGHVPCPACSGMGRLPRGGYQKRNPVNASRVVGELRSCCVV